MSAESVNAYKLMGHRVPGKSTSYKFVDSNFTAQWNQALTTWRSKGFTFVKMDVALGKLGSKNIGGSGLYGITYFRVINIYKEVTSYECYLNSNNSKIKNKKNYARSTACHELGHVLGLDDLDSGSSLISHARNRSKIYD